MIALVKLSCYIHSQYWHVDIQDCVMFDALQSFACFHGLKDKIPLLEQESLKCEFYSMQTS